MYFSRSVIASALLGYAAAQTSIVAVEQPTGVAVPEEIPSAAAPAGEQPTAAPGVAPPEGQMVNTHVVQVGGPNGTLRFYPENVQAQPGDLIQFQFNPKNHSVAQSTFDQPCVPIQNVMPNKTDAFYSGFMPSDGVAAGANGTANGRMTYTIRVMDSTPIWFYCSQGQHCQNGMVGAINAVATGNKTMEAFKALAANAPENLSPGQVAGEGIQTDPSASAPVPGSAQPTGGAGGAGGSPGEQGGSPTAGESPSGTSVDSPAQQSVNSAPGLSAQNFLGLGLGGIAALLVL